MSLEIINTHFEKETILLNNNILAKQKQKKITFHFLRSCNYIIFYAINKNYIKMKFKLVIFIVIIIISSKYHLNSPYFYGAEKN